MCITFTPVVQYLRSKMMPAFAVLIAVAEKKCWVKILLILGQSLVSWMVYMVPYSYQIACPLHQAWCLVWREWRQAFISAS
jgi:hypothetical protein